MFCDMAGIFQKIEMDLLLYSNSTNSNNMAAMTSKPTDFAVAHIKDKTWYEQQLKKELTELFKDGYEEVYFRDTDKDNAIMDRFKDKKNDHVICFILCEYMPYEDTKVNLHYDECYGGSDELATIKTKYKLNHEWETYCIANLYKDEELYEE